MDSTFTYQDAQISYRSKGKGPLIMLVHGFAEDSRVLNGLFDAIPEDYQVVLPDLPGSGNSEDNLSVTDSVEGMADALIALAGHLEADKFSCFGHSMGGYITLEIAEKAPAKLQAFGLLHSHALPDDEEKKKARKEGIEKVEKNGGAEYLKGLIPGLFAEAFTETNPTVIDTQIERGKQFSDASLKSYLTAMMNRVDRRTVLKTAAVPVLFVIGETDKAAPKEVMLEQVSLPERSSFTILKKTAHMGMFEEPDLFNKTVVDFLETFIEK